MSLFKRVQHSFKFLVNYLFNYLDMAKNASFIHKTSVLKEKLSNVSVCGSRNICGNNLKQAYLSMAYFLCVWSDVGIDDPFSPIVTSFCRSERGWHLDAFSEDALLKAVVTYGKFVVALLVRRSWVRSPRPLLTGWVGVSIT